MIYSDVYVQPRETWGNMTPCMAPYDGVSLGMTIVGKHDTYMYTVTPALPTDSFADRYISFVV